MTPEPTPVSGMTPALPALLEPVTVIRTTAGLTLAATAMVADDSLMATGWTVPTLVAWGAPANIVPAIEGGAGVYGELAVVPAAAVMKHPPSLSWQQAAAVWMQYLTAYGALVGIADLKAGETVVIPAASSSVGIAASQIANMIGAIPIALTRSGKKRQSLLDLGFRHVIATDEQDLVAEVRRLTRDQGARVVFDPVGGPTVAKLTAAMAPRGILFQYGALEYRADPIAVDGCARKIAHDPRLHSL